MKIQSIYIVGYPRSGNTWTNRLLSDLLDSPLANPRRNILSREFCQTGRGGYLVIKTHWYRKQWSGKGKLVFVQRDPRDVIVSLLFYRSRTPSDKNITETINGLCEGYETYLRPWLNETGVIHTRYEWLHARPVIELQKFCIAILGKQQDEQKIKDVIARQSFKRWKSKYDHSMRKGAVGDWKNYLNPDHLNHINSCLGKLMTETGYI